MKIAESSWNATTKLLTTTLQGEVNSFDIDKWTRSLEHALSEIEDYDEFKILINLHGFKADNINTHKKFRVIIPLTLADYGFRVGYVDLFENVSLPLKNTRGISCVAAVHVHHDEGKIGEYDKRFGKSNERFFTDPDSASTWIDKIMLQ